MTVSEELKVPLVCEGKRRTFFYQVCEMSREQVARKVLLGLYILPRIDIFILRKTKQQKIDVFVKERRRVVTFLGQSNVFISQLSGT